MSTVDFARLLPAWAVLLEQGAAAFCMPGIEQRMDFVIQVAARNVEEKTGGPFGAAVFERDSGKLIAMGMNVVLSSQCSHAHAEMLALALAQQRVGSHDLGAEGLPAHELVTSCEPCAMCLGAIPWSGVKRVICGARDADVRGVGFDEGDKISHWRESLTKRGIEVLVDVQREQAIAVLQRYRELGGTIY